MSDERVSVTWTWRRTALAAVGALVLAAGGAGAYLATQRGDVASEQDGTAVLRMHGAPRPLPELDFEDGKGDALALSGFRGKTVLLNVWATWCPPCREEMPSLDRLQQALGGPGFEVVALSIDAGGAQAVERFYKEMGIGSLAIYVDPGMRAASRLATPGVPTTLLIDPRGQELGRHAGPAQWDDPAVVRVIAGHLPR